MSAAVSPEVHQCQLSRTRPTLPGANLGQQLLGLGHRVDERVAASSTQGRRADVLEAESDAVVSEDAADATHPVHVTREVLPVGQTVAGWADPGADTRDTRPLQPCGKRRKVLDRLVVPGRVGPGVVWKKSGPPHQPVALHLVAQPRQVVSLIARKSCPRASTDSKP